MAQAEPTHDASSAGRLRLDRWLFFSRLVKSRTLAAKMIETGHVRVNGDKIRQPRHAITPGDVLTLALPPGIRIVRLLACGTRRGPASEAQTLYSDMTPPPPAAQELGSAAARLAPSPGRRPTKHERDSLQRLKRARGELEG